MLTPDILLVEADHDMRNPADFLVLNKLAKGILRRSGRCQGAGSTLGLRESRSSTRRFRTC